MSGSLLGATALCLMLTAHQGAQEKDHDTNTNRRIPDIEYQKRAPRTKMQVGEIDDIAVERPVEDVAERSAEDHAQRDLVDAVLLAPDPVSDAECDRTGQRHQHPPSNLGRRV